MSTQLPKRLPEQASHIVGLHHPVSRPFEYQTHRGIGGRGSWPHFGVHSKIKKMNRGFWKGKAPARNSIEMYWIVITGRRPEKMHFFLEMLARQYFCEPPNLSQIGSKDSEKFALRIMFEGPNLGRENFGQSSCSLKMAVWTKPVLQHLHSSRNMSRRSAFGIDSCQNLQCFLMFLGCIFK
jgi:hypothetical protein